MATTSPINGLPIPDDASPNDPPIHFQAFANVLDSRIMPRFATSTARDSAIPSPSDGMFCTMTDTDRVLRHDGTKWIKVCGPVETLIENGSLGSSGNVPGNTSAVVSGGTLSVPVAAYTGRIDYVCGIAPAAVGQFTVSLTVGSLTAVRTVNATAVVPVAIGLNTALASGSVSWSVTLQANQAAAVSMSYSSLRVTI